MKILSFNYELVTLELKRFSIFATESCEEKMALRTSVIARHVSNSFASRLSGDLQAMKDQGTYKNERVLQSKQGPRINANGLDVLNFCANNYVSCCFVDVEIER